MTAWDNLSRDFNIEVEKMAADLMSRLPEIIKKTNEITIKHPEENTIGKFLVFVVRIIPLCVIRFLRRKVDRLATFLSNAEVSKHWLR